MFKMGKYIKYLIRKQIQVLIVKSVLLKFLFKLAYYKLNELKISSFIFLCTIPYFEIHNKHDLEEIC